MSRWTKWNKTTTINLPPAVRFDQWEARICTVRSLLYIGSACPLFVDWIPPLPSQLLIFVSRTNSIPCITSILALWKRSKCILFKFSSVLAQRPGQNLPTQRRLPRLWILSGSRHSAPPWASAFLSREKLWIIAFGTAGSGTHLGEGCIRGEEHEAAGRPRCLNVKAQRRTTGGRLHNWLESSDVKTVWTNLLPKPDGGKWRKAVGSALHFAVVGGGDKNCCHRSVYANLLKQQPLFRLLSTSFWQKRVVRLINYSKNLFFPFSYMMDFPCQLMCLTECNSRLFFFVAQ